jgi:hypothetical protein
MRTLPRLLLLTIPLLLAGPAWSLSITEIGEPGAPGEDGESVHASGSELATGSDPAELLATAYGGDGGSTDVPGGRPAGNGGGAGLDLFAASDAGEVTVRGTARGGAGGNGLEGPPAGDGAPVSLWNTVDGETSGPLLLSQTAIGGNAGPGSAGRAGEATSWLRREKAAGSLTLEARAIGGGPHFTTRRPFPLSSGAAGAPALASGHGVNAAGETRVLVSASGGSGSAGYGLPGQPGGDARVFAFGRTEGGGQPVFVGVPELLPGPLPGPIGGPLSDVIVCDYDGCAAAVSPFDGRFLEPSVPSRIGAWAGRGSGYLSFIIPPATPPGGDGGSAWGVSVGIAAGDSPVEVRDVASGGHGGLQVGMDEGGPGLGGDARSLALGVGGGAATVRAESSAGGGGSGTVLETAPSAGTAEVPSSAEPGGVPGGRAEATAIAMGHGEVVAQARAAAGRGSAIPAGQHPGGRAEALASASGSDGKAEAGARSSSPLMLVEARTAVDVLSSATVEAQVGPGDRARHSRRGRELAGCDARTEAVVLPDEEDVADALRREPDLADALQALGAEDIEALGSWQARQRQGRRGDAITSSLEIELTNADVAGLEAEVFIGLFAPELRRLGFESLRVTLVNGDEVLFDEAFDDHEAARDFLDGALLEVGKLSAYRRNTWDEVAADGTFDDRQAARDFHDGALLEVGVISRYRRTTFPGLIQGVATLRLELVTDARGAGLGLAFLVAGAPGGEPAP